MSGTPETDAKFSGIHAPCHLLALGEAKGFARRLERERNKWKTSHDHYVDWIPKLEADYREKIEARERERDAAIASSERLTAELHESNRIISADANQIARVTAERDEARQQLAEVTRQRDALKDDVSTLLEDFNRRGSKLAALLDALEHATEALNSTAETK